MGRLGLITVCNGREGSRLEESTIFPAGLEKIAENALKLIDLQA
jgi:hypothetical protein